jgi:1-acyl-sn-glycerol-3-phosphate acyltransferase
MRRAGYIRNDLDPETLVKVCKTSLDDGRCLIIFPEGTRTSPGSLPRFQRGFANIATLTKTPIQPIFIDCFPPFLFKGEPWWHVPSQKPHFRITVGERLDANIYSLYGQRSIAARKLVESLELYYADQMRNRRPRDGTQKADY